MSDQFAWPNPWAPIAAADPITQVNPWSLGGLGSLQNASAFTPSSTEQLFNSLGMPVEGVAPQNVEADIASGLAKLRTVNPGLADQMEAQISGVPEEDQGGIMGFLGDMGGAVMGGLGHVMEFIGRTSHIVPQFFNPDDEGAWYEDIGQALSGEDQTNWNEVFQNLGWDGEGLSGVLRAGVGLVLDIATDPLTAATLAAGAGLSAARRGAMAAETIATRSAPFVERAMATGLGTVAERQSVLSQVWKSLSGADFTKGSLKLTTEMTEDAATVFASQAGRVMSTTERLLAADMYEAAANVYGGITRRTFSKFLRSGGSMSLRDGAVNLAASDMRALLNQGSKIANFTLGKAGGNAMNKAMWQTARANAGALGGMRFAYAVPFTRLRYMSPMLPFSDMLSGAIGLGRAGRFAAGLSMGKKLDALVRAGKMTWDDAALVQRQGIRQLAKGTVREQELFELMRAEGSALGSAFWSISEQVGGLTQVLSPGAKLQRRGLGFYFASERLKAMRTGMSHLRNHLLYDVAGEDIKGGLTARQTLYRQMRDNLGLSSTRFGNKATNVQRADYATYLDALPPGAPISAEQIADGSFDQWFWSGRARMVLNNSADETGQVSEEVRAKLQMKLDNLKATLGRLTPAQRETLDALSAVEARGRDLLNRYGVISRNVAFEEWETMRYLPREQMETFQQDAAVAYRGEWHVDDSMASGIDDRHVLPHQGEGVAGIRMTRGAQPGGSVPVAPAPRNPLVIGATRGAPDGAESVPGVMRAGDIVTDEPILREQQELADQFVARLNTSELNLDASTLADIRAAVVAEGLAHRAGMEYDSLVFRGAAEDGSDDVLILLGTEQVAAWKLVKVLNDAAPLAQETTGFFHRSFTEKMRSWLHGDSATNERLIVHKIRDMESKSLRKTALLDLDEAEEAAREVIETQLRDDGASDALIAQLWAKDENGVFDLPIFERDPLLSHEAYVNDIVEAYRGAQMGEFGERMNALGKLLPTHFGRVAQLDLARASWDEQMLKKLENLPEEVQLAAAAMVKKERAMYGALEKKLNARNESLARILERWGAGEELDRVILDEAGNNPALERLIEAAGDVRDVVSRERRTIERVRAEIALRSADTAKVEDLMQTNVYRYLDELIDERASSIPVEHLTRAKARSATAMLNRSIASGRGRLIGDGVYRVELDGGGVDYLVTESVGGVVGRMRLREGGGLGSLAAKTGAAPEATVQMMEGRHGAQRMIQAYFQHENISDMPALARFIRENTFSDDGAKFIKRAMRKRLQTLGQLDPTQLRTLLDSGELAIRRSDGTVLTRAGVQREAGKGAAVRVFSREDLTDQIMDVVGREVDLEHATSRTLERAKAKLARIVRTEVERTGREATAAQSRLSQATSQFQLAQAELNRILGGKSILEADPRPAIVWDVQALGGNRTGFTQLSMPGLDGVWVHSFIAEEMNNIMGGAQIGQWRKLWREFALGPWKKWATYRSPGFHIRNAMGAWFNNLLAGVTVRDYHFTFRMMAARDNGFNLFGKRIAKDYRNMPIPVTKFNELGLNNLPSVAALRGRLTYGQLSDMLADQGIGRANATAVAMASDVGSDDFHTSTRHFRGIKAVDRGLRKTSTTVEDFFRVAAWSAGMRETGGDLYGARAFVMMRHGDYEDLTEGEQFIKDLVPFYKWMRTNLPYQMRMLLEKPGFYSAIGKTQGAVLDAQGIDRAEWRKNTPDWMQRSFNIPIPFSGDGDTDPLTYAALDMPYGDLYKGGREYVSSFLPMVLDVAESLVVKQDIFTGRPLGERMVPAAGIFNLPGFKELLAAFPGSQIGPDGQLYITDTLDNVMGGVPIAGRFRNWLTAEPGRVENRWSSIYSYFAGVPVRTQDLDAAEQAFYYEQVLPTLDLYRDMGVIFPDKDQLIAAGLLAQTAAFDQVDPVHLWPTGVVSNSFTTAAA